MTYYRDVERVEEEIAGVERPQRPRGLASEYLRQAAEAFHAAGDPEQLYAQWRPDNVRSKPFGWDFMRSWAREDRLRYARNCVLFSAFATEAFVNEFLAAFELSNRRLKELDRKPTMEKLLAGTAEAYGEAFFHDGREPVPVLRSLFDLRNRLVHPKPGFGPTGLLGSDDPEHEEPFAMTELAEYVVMVGGVGDVLTWRAYGYERFDVVGRQLWMARPAVREYATRRLEVPDPDEPAEPTIWQIVGDHLDKMQPMPDHPDATWTQVRKARDAREQAKKQSS